MLFMTTSAATAAKTPSEVVKLPSVDALAGDATSNSNAPTQNEPGPHRTRIGRRAGVPVNCIAGTNGGGGCPLST
jgi:hypothetical protein